jgi:hypothetical protein
MVDNTGPCQECHSFRKHIANLALVGRAGRVSAMAAYSSHFPQQHHLHSVEAADNRPQLTHVR